MERKIFAVTTIISLITFFCVIMGASAKTVDIEGPWLWMIAPVPFNEGGADSIDFDSLAEASCGVVDEQIVATQGANAGDWVGIYQWTAGEISVERPGWLDLLGNGNINDCLEAIGMIKGNVDHATAYALINIESPMAQAATIKVGSDDAIKVWLNGVVEYTNAINRSTKGYQNSFSVNLIAGDNLLMVKVSEQANKWRMFIGLDVPNPNALVFSVPQGQAGVHPLQVPQIKGRPVVRLIHFVPDGKPFDLKAKNKELITKIEKVKAFHGCTMRDFGHITFDVGKRFGKTFNYHPDPYVIHSNDTEAHWLAIDDDKVYDAVWNEIQSAWDPAWGVFDPTTDIYLVMMEGDYEAGVGGKADIGNGRAIVYNMNWLTIAHELGHTFGLGHNFGDARYMMSYCNHTVWKCDTTYGTSELFSAIHGFFSTDHCDSFDFDNRVMSESTADWLDVHRAFNPPQVATDDPATIEIIEPANGIILRGTTTFPLVVHYADNDLPHQIQLYVPVTAAEEFAEGMKLHKAHTLPDGHTAWNITYPNFSDMMVDQDILKIRISSIDSYGNITSTEHALIKTERADVDKVGGVNAQDVFEVRSKIGSIDIDDLNKYDVNGDGKITEDDVSLVENVREDVGGNHPVVRLHYVYPKDGARDPNTEQDLVTWTQEAQDFYRTEMERHGFGSKTFQFDPIVRVHQSDMTRSEIEAENNLANPNVMNDFFGKYILNTDGEADIHIFFIDDIDKTEFESFFGAAAYEYSMAYTVVKGHTASTTIAHELGHNLGFLAHLEPKSTNIDGMDKFPIMSINCPHPPCDRLLNPIEKQFLLEYEAEWLNNHTLFNNRPLLGGTKTEFSFLNLKEAPKTGNATHFEFTENNPSSIKFKVKDEDGVYMIMRLYKSEYYNSVYAPGMTEVEVSDEKVIDNFTNHSYIQVQILVMDNLGNVSVWGWPLYSNAWNIWRNPAGAPTLVSLLPTETTLLRNYPNPFNPETWIPYQLSEPANVTLTIYNIRGHVVRDLDLGHQCAGIYQSRTRAAHWDGRNAQGEPVASGIYFYTLTAGDFTATRKMLILK